MLFSLFSSLLAAAIISNVLLHGIGLLTLTKQEIRVKPVLISTSLICVLALLVFIIDHVLYHVLLVPFGLEYLNLLFITLLIIGLNEAYQYVVKRIKYELPKDKTFGLHSILLLVGFMGFLQMPFEVAFISVVGSLIGFVAFAVLFVMISSKIRVSPILKSFKGLPILLIILGLIALVVTGLGGIF